jgi:hypothetical protein
MDRIRHRIMHEEDGGVLVLAAVSIPLLIVVASLVVDVGNWFEHKRHLQMQADAAALAGASAIAIPCVNEDIETEVTRYGQTLNPQVGGTSPDNVHLLLNSPTYYNQSSPVDETVNTGDPCEARMVDVKLTETGLPWIFKAAQVPFINAHARASILTVDTLAGALPVGVPDVNPRKMRITFIDEIMGSTLGSTELQRQPGTLNGLAVWDNAAAPLSVTTNVRHIGVRVAIGGHTSTTCGDPLVHCFDADSDNGILYARGYSEGSGAQPGEPHAGNVTLSAGSCPDAYFSASDTTCTIGVHAEVDFGGNPAAVGAQLTARVGRDNYPLTYNSSRGTWESGDVIPVSPNAGPIPIELRWEETIGIVKGETCKVGGGNKCKGSFGVVQRAFSGSDPRSGPIKLAQISEDGAFPKNSFETCASAPSCTHNLVVRIGITGSLQDAAGANDPPVSLRVTGGSQNQSLDCDPDYSNLSDELAYGCRPSYRKNSGTPCVQGTQDLWGSPQPWDCVALQTGTAVNQVPEGMNLRVLGERQPTSCTSPNNWADYPNLSPDDPRIVQVFLTPYGSFTGSGSENVPVTNFATFYVTGWTSQGQGFANPCQGNGDDPVPNNDSGYIVGHFIKYLQKLDNATGSELCDFDAFGSCFVSLTD